MTLTNRQLLLSVRQPWADLILDRRKRVELRRKRPADLGEDVSGDTIYIVPTRTGTIAGAAIIGAYVDLTDITPPHLLADACITRAEYDAYRPTWAWYILKAWRYPAPVHLSTLGIARAPQSWQELTPDQVDTIRQNAYLPPHSQP